ncbi:TPA: Ig-like domain-containing protein [Vibrio harveyi]|nr:Ig-like domain-containing protein [Vibrio harveyi]
MVTKKAYTAKDRIYNGTHGNLSTELFEFDVGKVGLGDEDAIELGYLPVGIMLKELKLMNDDIGPGNKIQLFVQNKKRENFILTKEIDVTTKAFTYLEGIDFQVGDNGPFLLFAVLNPVQANIQKYAKNLDHLVPHIPPKIPALQSFKVTASNKTMPVGDVATVYASDPVPPKASTKGVVWTTSDPKIATVKPNGDVEGVTVGVATITGTIGSVTASIDITITAKTTTP